GLPDVALGVFGDVGEESDDGGGEALAAYGARLRERRGVDSANDALGVGEGAVEEREELVAGNAEGALLVVELAELVGGERAALQIGEEAAGAAGDVADVEADGAEAMRSGPKLNGREPLGVLREVFARVLERIEDRRDEGTDTGDRASHPGLGEHCFYYA